MNFSRRTFIFAGVSGVVALAALRYFPHASAALEGEEIMRAIVPVMLDGALPQDVSQRREAIEQTIANVDRVIAGLAPSQAHEIGRLFTLLDAAPVRWSLTRSTHRWSGTASRDVDAFLARLRDSRMALLRAAYDALHELVFAAWYGDPRSWSSIGYDGPPRLGGL